jgi:predicted AlkP superfamily phosphohydrolase/phosphomutase
LVFERFEQEMPTLTALRKGSIWGSLRSVDPPITVPAWSCMTSGRTPGELGVYGFRNRFDRSYDGLAIADSRAITAPRVWDLLSSAGGRNVIVGVPGTYPPSRVRGCMVSCFLAPSTNHPFTFPNDLADEIERVTGGYMLDVENFRSEDKDRIAQQIFDMSEQRFDLARHLATTRPWELFMFVDMGPDRLHHGFWAACDPDHPRHVPGNRYEHMFRDYYRALDRHLASFLEIVPDGATVMVVSDHGAQPMVGGFCLNEWLVERGFLVLRETPDEKTAIGSANVDWSRTSAWGDGGYYGRIFINVRGREPRGSVSPSEYETFRQQLIDEIEALVDHQGHPMGNRALRPEDLYPAVRGVAPDLVVYFGDLRWRAVGSLGLHTGLYTFENDTGPDDANHAHDGIFALSSPSGGEGHTAGLSLLDVAPTLQALLGIEAPEGQTGRVLV